MLKGDDFEGVDARKPACGYSMSGTPSPSGKLSGRGAASAEDAQRTPTQSHISPSLLVYEDKNQTGCFNSRTRQSHPGYSGGREG